jgi:hypothetical protein
MPGQRRPAERVALGTGHRQCLDGRCAWSAGTPPCTAMARLLVVRHTTSPRLQALLEAVLAGAREEAIQDVTVLARPALVATAIERAGRRWVSARHAGQPRVPVGGAQALPRPDLLPLSGGDRAAALWAVGPRRHRHHRSRAGGRGDHPGPGDGAVSRPRWPCSTTRASRTSRPAGSLAPRWRRLDLVCRLTWSAPVEAVLP